MIIKIVLIFGLLIALSYALVQRHKSRLVSISIFFVSVAGICFVAFPEVTITVANLLGVGRGADLVLYCWIVITLFVAMNLQFKIFQLQETVTVLIREQALANACKGGRVEDRGNSIGAEDME
jgi:hypothetical protein